MKTRLTYIKNWSELAEKSNWKTSGMARRCHVSVRTLERYFRRHVGRSPKAWLVEQRQRKGIQLLQAGNTIKEIAGCLGYRHASQFSREFKKHWGRAPTH